MDKKIFSIIVPVYGNEKNLPITIPYFIDHLDLFPKYLVEIILICDGSPDKSWEVMKELKNKYPDVIRIYKLATNSYRQIAIAAGMEKAKGDVIGAISADMQDPFEIFVDLIRVWENGNKLAVARRVKRKDPGLGWIFSNLFHRFLIKINSKYPKGGFDCFIIDSSLKNDYIQNITKNGFMPLVLLRICDTVSFVDYERKPREIGKSGYSFSRKLRAVFTTIIIETDKIFYWSIFVGAFFAVIGVLIGGCTAILYKSIFLGLLVAFVIILFSGIISLLGLVGMAIYNWAINLRNLPKYKIEKEGIEYDE